LASLTSTDNVGSKVFAFGIKKALSIPGMGPTPAARVREVTLCHQLLFRIQRPESNQTETNGVVQLAKAVLGSLSRMS
jgi:hypothetical protein